MRSDRLERLAAGLLVAESGLLLALVRRMVARPFWFNEQWRAWHLSLAHAMLHPSENLRSPVAAGYALLTRLPVALLGNREVAMRLPEVVSLPVLAVLTYVLARRWLGPLASFGTVALLLANRMVLTFSAELAPYTIEAAGTVAALLLWLGESRRVLRYAGMVAVALTATPVVFVLAPLLAYDAIRAVRAREWRTLTAPVATGGVALLHLGLYVGQQRGQTGGHYWAPFYVPHSPVRAVRFVARQLASYVPRALTGGTAHFPSVPDGEIALATPLRIALTVVVTAALLGGLVAALRDRRTRVVPLVLLAVLAGQLAGSAASAWPFGWTRVNTFLLPLAYLVAAVGVTRARPYLRRAYPAVAGAVVLLVALVAVRQVTTVRREAARPAFGTAMARFAAIARANGTDDDVVVLVHEMSEKGWDYYARLRDGGSGVRLSPARTILVDASGRDADRLAPFLAAHPDAPHVWVMALRGSGSAALGGVDDGLATAGYVRTGLWRDVSTGGLREYQRGR